MPRLCGGTWLMFTPSSRISPWVAVSKPASIIRHVVLPDRKGQHGQETRPSRSTGSGPLRQRDAVIAFLDVIENDESVVTGFCSQTRCLPDSGRCSCPVICFRRKQMPPPMQRPSDNASRMQSERSGPWRISGNIGRIPVLRRRKSDWRGKSHRPRLAAPGSARGAGQALSCRPPGAESVSANGAGSAAVCAGQGAQFRSRQHRPQPRPVKLRQHRGAGQRRGQPRACRRNLGQHRAAQPRQAARPRHSDSVQAPLARISRVARQQNVVPVDRAGSRPAPGRPRSPAAPAAQRAPAPVRPRAPPAAARAGADYRQRPVVAQRAAAHPAPGFNEGCLRRSSAPRRRPRPRPPAARRPACRPGRPRAGSRSAAARRACRSACLRQGRDAHLRRHLLGHRRRSTPSRVTLSPSGRSGRYCPRRRR